MTFKMITNTPLHADKKVQLKKLGTKKTRIFLILHVNKKKLFSKVLFKELLSTRCYSVTFNFSVVISGSTVRQYITFGG